MTTRLSSDGRTLTIRVPMKLQRRGGRRLIVAPESAASWAPPKPRHDDTLIKALARAHRWRRMLESGEYRSVKELAEAEKINSSYLSRILRLTLLAPDIVEAIIDGRQPKGLKLADIVGPMPVEWDRQRVWLGFR